MKADKFLLAFGLILFLALLGASFWKQSPVMLYVASAIPIFIVPFLPDIRTSQKLHPNKQSVQIMKLTEESGEEAEWLVISFTPGTIYWNKKWLFVPVNNLNPAVAMHTDDYTASLTVLKYDLRSKKTRNGSIAIDLRNLTERTQGLSYTVDEVNRLMIRMDDLEDLLPIQAAVPIAPHPVLNSTPPTGV